MNTSTVSVITLSSDDENEKELKPPPKKKKRNNCNTSDLVIISDDENNQPGASNNGTYKNADLKSDNCELTDDEGINSDKAAFEVFLNVCAAKVENAKYKEVLLKKIRTIKLLYKRVNDYVTTDEFKQSLTHQLKLLDDQPKFALHSFNIIFQQLKYAWKNANKDDVDERRLRLMRKVQKRLDLLHAKIRKLENTELTLSEMNSEDSYYIQLQRYKKRAVQLYEKLCELQAMDAHADRIIHKKIRFSQSKYDCINKAIRNNYKNNSVFPTFYDFHIFIKKCVEKNKLKISNTELEVEIKQCFEALGNLLQKRRKQDLFDIHVDFITSREDPADTDDSLQNRLRENGKQGFEKLNALCTEFVVKQENGEDYSDSNSANEDD